jgi:hypothetical protein
MLILRRAIRNGQYQNFYGGIYATRKVMAVRQRQSAIIRP